MSEAYHQINVSTFRLRRRTPGSFLLVPCPKQGRSIRCQGQLEAAAAVILAACPLVVHIQEQPLSIWYTWRGGEGAVEIQLLDGPPVSPRRRQKGAGTSYIVPDFLVEMTDGSKRLVEVKPSDRLDRPIVQRKLAVGRLFAAQEGWTFHVVTEKGLYAGPLLDNVRLLNRYRQGRMDASVLRLRFATDDSQRPGSLPARPRPRTIQDFSEHQRQLLQRRWQALEPLTKLSGLPRDTDYALRCEDLRREGISCSARTLRRYFRAWHRAGKDRLALMPRGDRKGARGRPRRNSWLKRYPQVRQLVDEGTVESFFDGLNDQLSASLPGRTFRNWADRADYNPDDGPLLSYEALLEIVHIYLVDVYAIAKHPASETTRLEMWQESAAAHSPMLPAAADDGG